VSFAAGGKVTTSFGSGYDSAEALVRQPDGKLVAAGYASNGSNNDFALARYTPNGSLDTSFNGTGKVTTSIGSLDDAAAALVLQPDGKLVAAGTSVVVGNDDFALVRYNQNGSLDTGFNGTGKVTTSIGPSSDDVSALALQPDGKLVAVGYGWAGTRNVFELARYKPDGTLDTSFNGTGKVTTSIGAGNDTASALVLQPDGKIVVAGCSQNGSSNEFALARYKPDGSLDTSFNGTGKVATTFGTGLAGAQALALQPDGKLIAAGSYYKSEFAFALARYNPDGSLDTSFNGTGKVTTAAGAGTFPGDFVEALALQPDGKIVAAGRAWTGSSHDVALARYTTNGSLDTSFNGTGKVTTSIGPGHDGAEALVRQPDGKLVVAGYGSNGSNSDFVVARYRVDSALSVAKAGAGSVTSAPGGISCGSTCSAAFGAAVAVKLTATAAAGSSFVGWSGACAGTGTCTVSMGSDRAVTARFEADKTLTLARAGNGVGAVSSDPAGISCGSACAHTFRYGTVLTLTAAATPRSAFKGWSGACAGTSTCTVTMSAARSVTATFAARCIVPRAKGKALRTAKRALVKAHCKVGRVKKAFSAKVKQGRVIAQGARPGKKLAPGAKVRLTVSKGKKR
jgi:uncharacterized delta-60 repeat protein